MDQRSHNAEPAGLACPLCGSDAPVLLREDRRRRYWQCRRCGLIFVPPSSRPGPAAERARYDRHQNDPGDEGYRRFLSRLVDPLLERVGPGAHGLDFGSGPIPVLAAMMNARGRPTACYDPYYAPDDTVWARTYDFVTATEVLEHLFHPRQELDRLFGVIRPGGWLGVTTGFAPEGDAFAAWPYVRDATHVAFYGPRPFRYIAEEWRAWLECPEPGVVLLQKRGVANV